MYSYSPNILTTPSQPPLSSSWPLWLKDVQLLTKHSHYSVTAPIQQQLAIVVEGCTVTHQTFSLLRHSPHSAAVGHCGWRMYSYSPNILTTPSQPPLSSSWPLCLKDVQLLTKHSHYSVTAPIQQQLAIVVEGCTVTHQTFSLLRHSPHSAAVGHCGWRMYSYSPNILTTPSQTPLSSSLPLWLKDVQLLTKHSHYSVTAPTQQQLAIVVEGCTVTHQTFSLLRHSPHLAAAGHCGWRMYSYSPNILTTPSQPPLSSSLPLWLKDVQLLTKHSHYSVTAPTQQQLAIVVEGCTVTHQTFSLLRHSPHSAAVGHCGWRMYSYSPNILTTPSQPPLSCSWPLWLKDVQLLTKHSHYSVTAPTQQQLAIVVEGCTVTHQTFSLLRHSPHSAAACHCGWRMYSYSPNILTTPSQPPLSSSWSLWLKDVQLLTKHSHYSVTAPT